MWVIGDIVFLGPVMLIAFSLLSTDTRRPQLLIILGQRPASVPFDLLRL